MVNGFGVTLMYPGFSRQIGPYKKNGNSPTFLRIPVMLASRSLHLETKLKRQWNADKENRFSAERIDKIRELLATSDLSIVAIAERFGCVPGRVSFINRKFRIRIYGKKRSAWTVTGDWNRTAI